MNRPLLLVMVQRATGNQATAIGSASQATGDQTVAVGRGNVADANRAVALGFLSKPMAHSPR